MNIAPGSVWLDARGAQSASHGERGIPRYVAEHAKALVETAPELIGSVAIDPAVPPPPTLDALIGSGVLAWHSNTGLGGREAPTTYHVMSAFDVPLEQEDIWPAWTREAGCRLVVTLYDLIPVIFRDEYIPAWGHWGAGWLARLGLVRAAHQVVTISQQTADDAIERLQIPEERITVIDSGVSDRFASLVGSRAEADALIRAELPKVRPGFLLYVGGWDHRKNMEGVIRAYSLLPESERAAHQLVIPCKLAYLRRLDLMAFARDLGIPSGQVLLPGFVPDRELAALYRSCDLFIFPSLYEGAGLPILEAMSCGAPVVASNTSAMPELLGDLEGTFDPADPEDIAGCLRLTLQSPELLEQLRERSRRRVEIYTWERVAKRTIEAYERALEVPLQARARRRPRERKRLAVVTPWPPQASGAAAYSRRLVEELNAYADIDVIVPAESAAQFERSPDGKAEIRTDAEFEWQHGLRGYDRYLYVLGSSVDHLHALGAMMKVPGIVLAHDVRLLDLYRELHRRSFSYDPHWLEAKLVEMYGERIPLAQLRRIPFGDREARERVTMTREVQAHAELLLVHSRHQADLLRLERPRDAAPSEVVPRGIPEIPASNGAGHHDRDGDKGPHLVATGTDGLWPNLLEAFAQTSGSRPGARLTFLGEIGEGDRAAIGEMASRLGIGAAVELPGRVEKRRYVEALQEADLAVQLRAGAEGGEASEAICDCIAARVPTIVTEAGWRAELPVPVVLPVPTDCTSTRLAEQIDSALGDTALREESRKAQDAYAAENSFPRVAERLAEHLFLD